MLYTGGVSVCQLSISAGKNLLVKVLFSYRRGYFYVWLPSLCTVSPLNLSLFIYSNRSTSIPKCAGSHLLIPAPCRSHAPSSYAPLSTIPLWILFASRSRIPPPDRCSIFSLYLQSSTPVDSRWSSYPRFDVQIEISMGRKFYVPCTGKLFHMFYISGLLFVSASTRLALPGTDLNMSISAL